MKRIPLVVVFLTFIASAFLSTEAFDAAPSSIAQRISLVSVRNGIPGSFVGAQSVYADSQRIYLCSFQGQLFVLQRNPQSNFPLIQTISLGSPLAAVRGDANNVYVSGRDGNLYVFSKTFPLRLVQTVALSTYGLMDLKAESGDVYVARGQAALTATNNRVYVSQLNPGDFAIEMSSGRTYAETNFAANTILIFNRRTGAPLGSILNPATNHVSINTWEKFIFLTHPGCCGLGTYIYDSRSLRLVQYLFGNTNTAAGIKTKGVSFLITGNETGEVELYGQDNKGAYQLINSVGLRALTGFTDHHDIEIRGLWIDGIDNLVFAASSWGTAETRSPTLPSFFVLEITSGSLE